MMWDVAGNLRGGRADVDRVEAALLASEARYRTLFEHSQVGILLADAASRYVDANPAACTMFGYSREEFVGLSAPDIVRESETPHIEAALTEIHGDADHRREWQFRRKDGTSFSGEVVAFKMPDGMLLGLIRDLSERKQAADYRLHLAAIVESSRDAIIGQDLEGTVTSWNAAAQSLFGYGAGEMVGTSITRLTPAERMQEDTLMLDRLRRGERVEILETLRRTRDGRLIDVAVTVSPIRDDSGRIVGASKVVRDVTASKTRQHEVMRLSRLYAALSQVNRAIVRTHDRDSLFREVCRVLVESGGLSMAWIGWHEPGARRLWPVAEFGDDSGHLRRISIHVDDRPGGQGPSARAFRARAPYICNDIPGDPDTLPWRAEFERRGFHACAALPIRIDGDVCGILSVYAAAPAFFRDREITLLEEAAANISFALENFEREAARRQMEQTLRSEKQFSDTMIESMPGIVYFYDAKGKFLRWNRNFEAVTGRTAAEIAAMHPLDFFLDRDRTLLEERIGEVFASGASSVEADLVARDGARTPCLFTGRRVSFNGEPCLVGVGIDISDRRRAEDRMAVSERQYRELVEHANSIILRWNSEGSITFLNEYGQRFFGYSAEEILGRNVMGTIVPATESSGRDLGKLMEDIRAHPEAFEHSVNENVRRDGGRVWVAWTNRIVRDAGGRVAEILSVGSDMSERMAAEAERERRERAEAADRLKSAFLATMSHELRTPLNSIIGFTGIMLQGLAGPLNAEQDKQLGMVRSSARHLLALVNDVLDLSKIEAGQLEVARQPFDVRRSIARAVDLVTPLARAKRLALHSRIEPALGTAIGDQRRFEQILVNLLGNAIKFTDEGEATLEADVVEATGAAGARAIRVRIADTGIGIAAEDLAALFQPFRQVDTGLARSQEGTGLGLAICRRLAGLMGGEVTAESSPGQGSCFTLTLPLVEPASP